MAYVKKTWTDRQAEYPLRRKLTATGTTDVYDVSREEGLVIEEGDALNAANLNDLETRIENQFAVNDTHIANTTIHVTAEEKTAWNGKAGMEKGTWAPTVYGSTTAGAPAYSPWGTNYARCGNIVVLQFSINFSNIGGMAGALTIDGVPFAVKTGFSRFAGSAERIQLTSGTGFQFVPFINGNKIMFSNVNTGSWLNVSDLTNASTIVNACITYPID